MKQLKGRILLVDDDEDVRIELSDSLENNGYEVITAPNGRKGLEQIKTKSPDLVILDLQMPEMDGMAVLHEIEQQALDVTVIVLTAYGSVNRAVEAMKAGAFDFIEKNYDSDHLPIVIDKAMERVRLKREIALYREEAVGKAPVIIGSSEKMQTVYRLAGHTAGTSTTVLLLGETGSGKEMIAQKIHYEGNRRDKPFITVNCTALPDHLIESELFGHEKGAFTGADRQRKGKFELANGGTILLDEIGATKKEFQVKLLRVLEGGEFERLGGEQTIKTDIHIIAATNRDLQEEMEEGNFLPDLYFRLNVFPVTMPPLRERKEDIPDLVHFFIRKYASKLSRNVTGISDTAMGHLIDNDWPGNVRELEHAIHRAVLICGNTIIQPKHLSADIAGTMPAPSRTTKTKSIQDQLASMIHENEQNEQAKDVLELMKVIAVRTALEQSGGNVTQATTLLGLKENQRKKIERIRNEYGLEVKDG